MSVLKSQLNIGVSAQTSGIPWWTTDVGGYSGGHSQDPVYRETVGRWFQYGFTCPLLRQHGARDHTCPWFYGNETELIIEDIIRLRHAMKPYFSAQLDLLNETGRPFNRPLMWDFPGDPKTWVLAESGIGDSGGTPSPPAPPTHTDGDFVVMADCTAGNVSQAFTLDTTPDGNLKNLGACLDDGGNAGAAPPRGPYKVSTANARQFAFPRHIVAHSLASLASFAGIVAIKKLPFPFLPTKGAHVDVRQTLWGQPGLDVREQQAVHGAQHVLDDGRRHARGGWQVRRYGQGPAMDLLGQHRGYRVRGLANQMSHRRQGQQRR